jgi:hypothetical protein
MDAELYIQDMVIPITLPVMRFSDLVTGMPVLHLSLAHAQASHCFPPLVQCTNVALLFGCREFPF